MRVGTKSLLFGAHQLVLHPLCVLWAWWRLYGFPWDPRLWVCAGLHDLGYWGKRRMDDAEGQRHVELGARLAGALFGPRWRALCLGHSGHYADAHGIARSRLFYADKLATALVPRRLYLWLVRSTGEIAEYRWEARRWVSTLESDEVWHAWVCDRMRRKALAGAEAAVPAAAVTR